MNFNFTSTAFDDYLFWQKENKKTLEKINKLLKDISRSPFDGLGKPEALKGNLSGFYSRRIDDKNRLVYKISDDECFIVQCRTHYSDK